LITSVPERGDGAVLEKNYETSLVGSHFPDWHFPWKHNGPAAGFAVLIRFILDDANPTRRFALLVLDSSWDLVFCLNSQSQAITCHKSRVYVVEEVQRIPRCEAGTRDVIT